MLRNISSKYLDVSKHNTSALLNADPSLKSIIFDPKTCQNRNKNVVQQKSIELGWFPNSAMRLQANELEFKLKPQNYRKSKTGSTMGKAGNIADEA